MANLYDISALTYTPKTNPEWYSKALFSGKLIENGYVGIHPNVKNGEMLSMIDWNGASILQKETSYCGWNPEEAIKLDQKPVSVTTYVINAEDCVDKFESTFLVEKMKPGANQDELPIGLAEFTLDLFAKETSKEIEELIIAGDSANANEFDGLKKQLDDSATSIKITGSTLTVSNVLLELQKVYAAIPEDTYNTTDVSGLEILVSYNTMRVLNMALTTVDLEVIKLAFSFSGEGKDLKTWLYGIEIVPAVGLGNKDIIAIAKGNWFLLTDLVSDFAEIELGNFPKPQDHKIFVKGRLKLGVAVLHEDQTVIYG